MATTRSRSSKPKRAKAAASAKRGAANAARSTKAARAKRGAAPNPAPKARTASSTEAAASAKRGATAKEISATRGAAPTAKAAPSANAARATKPAPSVKRASATKEISATRGAAPTAKAAPSANAARATKAAPSAKRGAAPNPNPAPKETAPATEAAPSAKQGAAAKETSAPNPNPASKAKIAPSVKRGAAPNPNLALKETAPSTEAASSAKRGAAAKAKAAPSAKAASSTEAAPAATAGEPEAPAATAAPDDEPRFVIDLSAELQIARETAVPPMQRGPDGRPIVAWARVGAIGGRANAPKSWVAQLASTGGRIERAFVNRAASRKVRSTVVCDDPFILETEFVQLHPLAPGVYEASSTWTGGPPGYEGRATFDVGPDGTIAIVGVGPRDRSFTPEVERDLVARIAVHDEREGGATSARITQDHAEREGERSVENDALIEQYGFPDLEGTPKQVSWAMSIRKRAFEELSRNSGNPKMWVGVVCAQTEASWWIDRRNRAASELVRLRIAEPRANRS